MPSAGCWSVSGCALVLFKWKIEINVYVLPSSLFISFAFAFRTRRDAHFFCHSEFQHFFVLWKNFFLVFGGVKAKLRRGFSGKAPRMLLHRILSWLSIFINLQKARTLCRHISSWRYETKRGEELPSFRMSKQGKTHNGVRALLEL